MTFHPLHPCTPRPGFEPFPFSCTKRFANFAEASAVAEDEPSEVWAEMALAKAEMNAALAEMCGEGVV